MKLFEYRLYDNNKKYHMGYIVAKGIREAKKNLKEIFSIKRTRSIRVYDILDTKTGFFIFDDQNKEIFSK